MIDEKLKKLLSKKINEIVNEIEIEDINNFRFGLLDGKVGLSLFNFYLYRFYNKNQYNEKATEFLLDTFEIINSNLNSCSFCSGAGGFCWALEHLIQNNFIERDDVEEVLTQLDSILYQKMIKDIDQGFFDYLHGATGIGYYFLKRSKYLNNCKDYIYDLIEKLYEKSICEKDGSIKWEGIFGAEEKKGYNFSLSHGMASIIVLLSKTLIMGINENKSRILLEGSIKYILKYRNKSSLNSIFPSYICEEEQSSMFNSRLAWCYGDLGIAFALYHGSIALNDSRIEKISINVFLHASNRKDLKKEHIDDAGLCHGTAGIAHIYNRMYRNTGINEFKDTAKFWFNETLKMAKFKDGKAGYQTWHSEKNGGPKNEYGILEGIAGIGLALHSWVTQTEPTWDECLLLS